jgi:hypothetical protein
MKSGLCASASARHCPNQHSMGGNGNCAHQPRNLLRSISNHQAKNTVLTCRAFHPNFIVSRTVNSGLLRGESKLLAFASSARPAHIFAVVTPATTARITGHFSTTLVAFSGMCCIRSAACLGAVLLTCFVSRPRDRPAPELKPSDERLRRGAGRPAHASVRLLPRCPFALPGCVIDAIPAHAASEYVIGVDLSHECFGPSGPASAIHLARLRTPESSDQEPRTALRRC